MLMILNMFVTFRTKRDLPGVVVGKDNRVKWDPTQKRKMAPDYAMKFVKGKSTKPFGRLWMDEIVNTVVTRAKPHNQIIIHPSQDRVRTYNPGKC
ncbi:DNA (cytosine-5)-methyltransferase 1-like protein [Corchorus olitorius]|uniref:DNA (Cytosine-5)-methyltransferase 1-like protein n=1 Tax=Corchorus olitorius TaxID=93759 RepID=A0A1R3H0U7_9ROSI|nr:DNA (cytosine-5)-methyltransferase 1-like protein [Corchorus olitorius]